jgi:hypothetical protein
MKIVIMMFSSPAFDPSSPYDYRANWQTTGVFSDPFSFYCGWLSEPSFHTPLAFAALPALCGS